MKDVISAVHPVLLTLFTRGTFVHATLLTLIPKPQRRQKITKDCIINLRNKGFTFISCSPSIGDDHHEFR